MSVSVVSAALQDALEKGDVVELEQAIVAAEDAVHLSPRSRKASSSLVSLIARAKDMYLVHMDACRSYVKPLRKACKELNERAIFEALVRARGAPDEVQLCMYTDLCNAESLRHEIVEAQKLAVHVLDATSSEDVENFLTDYSPFLEDRTILSLVQKREDLLLEEKRRQTGWRTPLRSALRGMGGSDHRGHRDPLEDLGRSVLEDGAMPPVSGITRNATPRRASANRHLVDSGGRAGTPSQSATPSSSGTALLAYPAVRHAMEKSRESGLQRAVEEGPSLWMHAMRSLMQQAFEGVAREEDVARLRVEDSEVDGRAQLYRAEMLERVQCWASARMPAAKKSNGTLDEWDDAAAEREVKAPKGSREEKEAWVRSSAAPLARLPPPPPATPAVSALLVNDSENPAGNTPTRVYAHSLSAYPLRPPSAQQQQQRLIPSPLKRVPRSCNAEGVVHAESPILGGAVRAQLDGARNSGSLARCVAAAAQNTPRMSRGTPNISPIKEVSTTSGVASLLDQDSLYHRDEAKSGWGDGIEKPSTSRHPDTVDSAVTAAISLVSSSMTASSTLELRRIQARLRAVLQEEDIHRRDIEGTEDFDRSVFLFPVSARIAMLRRSATNGLRMY
ncbi:hypothetical protein ABL78_2881 [Leptomonas seymouri]|uniref:Uncharacterized protein n=1 Tax=Leptomonas seymouri TaxID=5684 RepID=A0A0N1I5K9_LEPSE|nr:hypothetical protein ABL78_2881 [Leptomonas seymouri]|eukprot:KPI88005.1 hypothetical protein ABL78_2881 [Leptomonas seymouri]